MMSDVTVQKFGSIEEMNQARLAAAFKALYDELDRK